MKPQTGDTKTVRISCKCIYCKQRWMEEVTATWSATGSYWSHYAGQTHRCEKINAGLWHEAEYHAKRNSRFIERDQNYFAFTKIRSDMVKGRLNPEVKCDARCTNAVGPSCDCSCGGKHHGDNSIAA